MGNKIRRSAGSTAKPTTVLLAAMRKYSPTEREAAPDASARPQSPAPIARPSALRLWANVIADRASTHPGRYPSATEVFDLPELCVMILMWLDPIDLLRVQRVRRRVYSTVRESPGLQTKLFLRAGSPSEPWLLEGYIGLLAGSQAEAAMYSSAAQTDTTRYRLVTPLVINSAVLRIGESNYRPASLVDRVCHFLDVERHSTSFLGGRVLVRGLNMAVPAHASCSAMFLSQPPSERVFIGIFEHNTSSFFLRGSLAGARLRALGREGCGS